MIIAVDFKCPYCGFDNRQQINKEYRYSEVVAIHCNDEDGGCGRMLALDVELKPVITVYEMREVTP